MKRIWVFIMVLTLFCCLGFSEKLKNLSLDNASSIGLRIQTDLVVKTEGKASVRITTRWPTTVCLGEITGLSVEHAKLIFRAMVKSEIKGTAFLEMWVHVKGGQYFSRGLNNPVKDKSDWTSLQTPFVFQKGQVPDKVTLNLVINGTGTIWIDDIILSKKTLN